MEWFTFSALPVDLRLEYRVPAGIDALTPNAIRTRYDTTSKGNFVVWASDDQSLIGFKEGIDEVTLENRQFDKIVLVRWLPAKGSGMLSLETQSPNRCIIGSKRYSAESEAWIMNVLKALRSCLGERVVEAPLSHDA